MIYEQRAHCLRTLMRLVSAHNAEFMAHAVELEHAVFVCSRGVASAYPLLMIRAMQILERGRLMQLQKQRNAGSQEIPFVQILQMPPQELHDVFCAVRPLSGPPAR